MADPVNPDIEPIINTHFDIIHIDYIERIFDFLSPDDLLNAAELNANTAKAAEIVYARHYSAFMVVISITVEEFVEKKHKYKPIIVDDSQIYIYSAAVCSTFVERFGKFFEKLAVHDRDYTPITEKWHEVIKIIETKCSTHVNMFDLIDPYRRIAKEFHTPFEAVEKLFLNENGSLGKLTGLNEWFPNLKQLNILSFRNFYHHIPSIVNEIIRSAPQLEELNLLRHNNSSVNESDLRLINECQPNLKHLKFFWTDKVDGKFDEIVFKHVESCFIVFVDRASWRNLPLKFERLKDLTMIQDQDVRWLYSDLAINWTNFASEQIGLTKLYFRMRDAKFSAIHLSKLASRLTYLTEMKLLVELDFNALDYILSHFKSLQTLEIDYPGKEVHDLCSNFATRWIMEKNEDSMICKRK